MPWEKFEVPSKISIEAFLESFPLKRWGILVCLVKDKNYYSYHLVPGLLDKYELCGDRAERLEFVLSPINKFSERSPKNKIVL